MRIAIIATGGDLAHIPTEAQNLTNLWSAAGAEVTLIAGIQATRSAMQAAARQRVDRFWIAAHMDGNGIALADATLSIPELAQWIAMSQAGQGVLNGCDSAAHVLQLQRYADVDLAAAIIEELDDLGAMINAGYLAQAWIESGDLATAAQRATAGGAIEYRFFPAGRRPGRTMEKPQQPDPSIEILIRTLQGDPRWGNEGLIPTMTALRADLAEFREKDSVYRQQDAAWKAKIENDIESLRKQRLMNLALIFISVMIAVPVFVMLYLVWEHVVTKAGV